MDTNPVIANIGEFGLIERIKKLIPQADKKVIEGIGDDTAAIQISEDKLLLVTCDIQIEDTHFRTQNISAYQLGRRAVAINLSDIAAMGGTPTYALISLGLPRNLPVENFDQLFMGMRDQLGEFGAAIVGGNLAHSSDKMILDITLLGEVHPKEVLTRRGAQPGEKIFVTGSLGTSAAGFYILEKLDKFQQGRYAALIQRHLLPRPRVTEGRLLAQSGQVTAMIDISDGLASDLWHICDMSQVGAEIRASNLPIQEEVKEVAALVGKDPLELALHGGEDYELLFTMKPEGSAPIINQIMEKAGTPITEVGTILPAEEGRWIVNEANERLPLKPLGWDHFG